jgi:hypothetical protein
VERAFTKIDPENCYFHDGLRPVESFSLTSVAASGGGGR